MQEIKQQTIMKFIKNFIKRNNKGNANNIGLTIYYINLIKLNEGL